jgi:hypothetical protein
LNDPVAADSPTACAENSSAPTIAKQNNALRRSTTTGADGLTRIQTC